MAECNVVKKALGLSSCNKLPNMPKSIITTPMNFKATPEEAADPEFWQDAILAGRANRIYLWPNFVSFENISEEAIYEDTPLAYLSVRDGNYRFRFSIKESLCLHKAMFTHRATSGRAFILDIENQLIGTQDVAGNFMGFTVQLLHTEKLIIGDGSVSTKSPIVLALANNKELDQNGAIIDGSFVNTLNRLTDVTIEVLSSDDSEIVANVFATCDGTPVSGLILADFVLLDENGDPQSISGITEEDGKYTLTGSGWTSGTLSLDPPASLSIQAYESNVATVTIGS